MKNSIMNTQKMFESFIFEVLKLHQISILSEMDHESLIQISYASLNGKYRKYNGKVQIVIYYTMKIADFGELYKFFAHTPTF